MENISVEIVATIRNCKMFPSKFYLACITMLQSALHSGHLSENVPVVSSTAHSINLPFQNFCNSQFAYSLTSRFYIFPQGVIYESISGRVSYRTVARGGSGQNLHFKFQRTYSVGR